MTINVTLFCCVYFHFKWKTGRYGLRQKMMLQNFADSHTEIRHVDAHANLSDGAVGSPGDEIAL